MSKEQTERNPFGLIEYKPRGTAWQVWDLENQMFDVDRKNGELVFEWAGGGQPYVHEGYSGKEKRKIWFCEDFRPTNGKVEKLTDEEIESFGFVILKEPINLEEIIEAYEKY